jgi:hypothetical protein
MHNVSLDRNVRPPAASARQAESNRTIAEADARHLMSLLRVPPGASVPSRKPPRGTPTLLRQPAELPGTPYLAGDTRFTIVRGSPDSVIAWFAAHPPKGSTGDLSGSSGGPGGMEESQGFEWPSNAVLDERGLLVSAATFGPGTSLVRVDSGVVYTPNRPGAERVPAGIDRVVLTVTPPKGAVRVFTITKAASISALAASLAGLRRPDYTMNPGGPCLCGAGINEKFQASFFLPGGTTPSVTVDDAPMFAEMGVGNVDFSVGTTTEPVLEDGSWTVAKVVERLTGVHFVGVPGSKTPG